MPRPRQTIPERAARLLVEIERIESALKAARVSYSFSDTGWVRLLVLEPLRDTGELDAIAREAFPEASLEQMMVKVVWFTRCLAHMLLPEKEPRDEAE